MIKHTKRFFIFIFGGTIIVIGLLLLVLPGPGILVIIIGLAVLATEFVWAERILHHTKHNYHKNKNRVKKLFHRTKPESDVDLTDQS